MTTPNYPQLATLFQQLADGAQSLTQQFEYEGTGGDPQLVSITTPGPYSVNVPSGATAVDVVLYGAGGGGGAFTGASGSAGGGTTCSIASGPGGGGGGGASTGGNNSPGVTQDGINFNGQNYPGGAGGAAGVASPGGQRC